MHDTTIMSFPGLDQIAADLPALRRRMRHLARAVAEENLRVEHWELMRVLRTHDASSMSFLSETLAIPAPSAKRFVDELIDQSVLFRSVSPADGRQVLISLSVIGRARLARADAVVAVRVSEV